jgi:hypothetical protein
MGILLHVLNLVLVCVYQYLHSRYPILSWPYHSFQSVQDIHAEKISQPALSTMVVFLLGASAVEIGYRFKRPSLVGSTIHNYDHAFWSLMRI